LIQTLLISPRKMASVNDNNNKYIQLVREFVTELLCKLPSNLCYHNLMHTEEVVEACTLLALHSKLNPIEKEILIISAWFHDVGHIKTYFGHEIAGADIAEKFLKKINYPSEKIKKVSACILCTQYPPNPQNQIQKILCDADMFHLTLSNYEERSFILKQEIELVTNSKIPMQAWCSKNIEFLNSHCYFSRAGKKLFGKLKESNLSKFICQYCN